MDTLKNLKAYEYQWIIIKKNQVQDVDWDFHLPGEATTDPEGKMQLIEAPKIKFCSIEGYSKEPFEVTFKSKDE